VLRANGTGSGATTYPYQSLKPATGPGAPGSTNNLTLEPSAHGKPLTEGRDADALKLLIMRVQAALYSKGYDPGAIDGVLTPETQSALRMFQLAHGIRATGTMTTPTLDALGVRL